MTATAQGVTSNAADAHGMQIMRELALGLGRKLPAILQTEATECGLACLAMLAGYHGHRLDLASLRRRFPISQKGVTLTSIIDIAGKLDLSTRAVRLELSQLKNLRMPCILHWDMQHFVVLRSVRRGRILIHDPAVGERAISLEEVSASFSGVALEVWPGQHFTKKDDAKPVRILSLIGKATGLGKSFGQIIAIAFVLQILGLLSPLFMQWVIDHALVSGNRDLLTTLALGFGLLVLVTQAITVLSAWASMYLSTAWSVQWNANIFTHLLRLPMPWFEKRHLGDVVSRFGSAGSIQSTLTSTFITSVIDSVMVIFVIVLIFMYSPLLSWISIGAMTFYTLCRVLWYRPLRLATQEQIVHSAKQNSHFLETVRGARAIKLYRNQDNRRSGWLALLADQVNSGLRVQKMQILYGLINGVVFGIVGILVVWLAARMVLRGEFTVGMMMAYMSYQGQFSSRITSLIDNVFAIKMLSIHGERLADIVLTEQEKQTGEGRLVKAESDSFNPRIEIRGLRFRYSEHDPYVLDGLDLTIEPGESVAITGPSGCGKSTLMHTLLGVLPPTEGDVLFGGVSITNIDPQVLRSSIASVTQSDTLFAGSISDNISFFDSQADQRWIEECARMASIHDEIAAMPMGYNTFIGDMGTALSGGQQQRVLLARALYQKPRVLVLDEATSHLDLRRESMVSAAIRGLEITRIIVAHRPQTAEHADRIVLIDKGRVASERWIAPGMAVVGGSMQS